MREFQSGAIVTFSILVAVMGMLGFLFPAWVASAQALAMDLTILFGACLVASILAFCLTKAGKA